MKFVLPLLLSLAACKSQFLLEGKAFYDIVLLNEEVHAMSTSYHFSKSDYHVDVLVNSSSQWITAISESGTYKIKGTQVHLTPHAKFVCSNLFSDASQTATSIEELLPCEFGGTSVYIEVRRDTLRSEEIKRFGLTEYTLRISSTHNNIQLERTDQTIRLFRQWLAGK